MPVSVITSEHNNPNDRMTEAKFIKLWNFKYFKIIDA